MNIYASSVAALWTAALRMSEAHTAAPGHPGSARRRVRIAGPRPVRPCPEDPQKTRARLRQGA
jgi:hypothetical protein